MLNRVAAEHPNSGEEPRPPRDFVVPSSPHDDSDLCCRLFIASTINKRDDVEELHAWLDHRTDLRVLDVCGGYGRFRLHWPSPVEAWQVIDRSASFAQLGNAIARAHRIAPLTFAQTDVLDPVRLKRARPYDLVICAHNAINELPDLASLFTLFRDSLSVGGLLFLKTISLDLSDAEVSPWPAEIFEFDGEIWRSSISSVNRGQRQTLRTVFEATRSERLCETVTPRWIWPLEMIDGLTAAHGFRKVHVGRQQGARFYRKIF